MITVTDDKRFRSFFACPLYGGRKAFLFILAAGTVGLKLFFLATGKSMDPNMIPEVLYSAPTDSDQGADVTLPSDSNPIAHLAAVPDYILPEYVEKPFEPISACAIAESGAMAESLQYETYPLGIEELKSFLKLKLDGRKSGRRIKDVLIDYTENVSGLRTQLKDLKRRIKQITDKEKERNEELKKRIKKIEKALEKDRDPPKFQPHDLELSHAAKEAFNLIGSQGPLDASNLFKFIDTGKYDMDIPIRRDGLFKQVKDLRLRIDDISDEGNHEIQFPLKRINKAIDDIVIEIQ